MPGAATSSSDVPMRYRHSAKLCLLVAACALGAFTGHRCAAAAEGAGMAVTVVKVRSACFDDTLKTTGHVVPREEVLVRPSVEGYHIDKVLAEDGDTVKSGDVLADLAKPDWLPQLMPQTAQIKAPASGILIMPQIVPIGMPISARGPASFKIVRNGEFEIEIDIPKDVIRKVKTGETVQVQTLDGAVFAGTIRVVDPSVDFLTQVAHARVQIAGKPKLRVGTFATSNVDAGRDCDAAVPLSAVLFGPDGPVVQVVKDDHVETHKVTTGLASGADIEIRSGLKLGDAVVARAGMLVNNGETVQPYFVDAKAGQ